MPPHASKILVTLPQKVKHIKEIILALIHVLFWSIVLSIALTIAFALFKVLYLIANYILVFTW